MRVCCFFGFLFSRYVFLITCEECNNDTPLLLGNGNEKTTEGACFQTRVCHTNVISCSFIISPSGLTNGACRCDEKLISSSTALCELALWTSGQRWRLPLFSVPQCRSFGGPVSFVCRVFSFRFSFHCLLLSFGVALFLRQFGKVRARRPILRLEFVENSSSFLQTDRDIIYKYIYFFTLSTCSFSPLESGLRSCYCEKYPVLCTVFVQKESCWSSSPPVKFSVLKKTLQEKKLFFYWHRWDT